MITRTFDRSNFWSTHVSEQSLVRLGQPGPAQGRVYLVFPPGFVCLRSRNKEKRTKNMTVLLDITGILPVVKLSLKMLLSGPSSES